MALSPTIVAFHSFSELHVIKFMYWNTTTHVASPHKFRPLVVTSMTMIPWFLRLSDRRASVHKIFLPTGLSSTISDVESGFTKLLDLCKCTDRGSMGIEHKDWLLSTL
ncbi:unnamed protein product [Microthlaspi erraticum]|uniref:Uncharacterized protein n=1 Tax=Microthlaspi erraticum TaxID=1685480 RepID=A0A6D2I3E5_9BRAS|nr:unnamed protein product [Microthlaspi erraticum]